MLNLVGVLETGARTPASLRDDIARLSGAGDPTAILGHAGTAHRAYCTAPGIAQAGPLLLSLRGRPFWRGGKERAADSAFAAEVLERYRSRGRRFLDDLLGSFALTIIDVDAGSALLAIDRLGIERLTYSTSGGRLAFSTSARHAAELAAATPRIDHQAVLDYMFFHMIPAPRSIYSGVMKLPSASVAIWERGRLEISRYWNQRFQENDTTTAADFSAQLHDALRTATSASDPQAGTGAFLSGGLDSSTVAGFLSKAIKPARTFSIGFGYPDYDELSYAGIAARHFGCEAHEYTVTGADIAETFPLVARAYDEPFGNASALPVYHCARVAAAAGVRHLLAGDGGDELFAGNSRYVEQRIFEWYQHAPGLLRRGLLEPFLHGTRSSNFWLIRKARGYVDKANVPLPERLETWNFVYRMGPAEIIEPGFLTAVDTQAPLAHMRSIWEATPGESTLNKMLFYDWQITLADNDLRKVQQMCEIAGVSVSYPMLHPDVVELSMRIPSSMKLPGRKLRDFYKTAMYGFLPDAVLHKKKHGFGLPFGLWLRDSPALATLINDSLSDLRKRGIVRPAFIDRLLHLHEHDDARYYGVFVWVLAILEQWLQEHRCSL